MYSMDLTARDVVNRALGASGEATPAPSSAWTAPWASLLFNQDMGDLVKVEALIYSVATSSGAPLLNFKETEIEATEDISDAEDDYSGPEEIDSDAWSSAPIGVSESSVSAVEEADNVSEDESSAGGPKKSKGVSAPQLRFNLGSPKKSDPVKKSTKKKTSSAPALNINRKSGSAKNPKDSLMEYMFNRGSATHSDLEGISRSLGFSSRREFEQTLKDLMRSGRLFKKKDHYTI